MKRRRWLPVLVGLGAMPAAASGCKGELSTGPAGSATSLAPPRPTSTSITVRRGDPIPPGPAGAMMVEPRPTPSASVGFRGAGTSALPTSAVNRPPAPALGPPGAAAPAAAAPAAPAVAAPAAEAHAGAAPEPVAAVRIVHDHPPDQPCQPLAESEIRRALGDLK